jgi:hypothetical protein
MAEHGGRNGLPGVCTNSVREEERVFLVCFRVVDGGISSVVSVLRGNSLRPDRSPPGDRSSHGEEPKETLGGAHRKICVLSFPSKTASKDECSDVTAVERSS